jgi:hypothetical protein
MAAGPMVVFLIVLSFIFTLQAFRDYRRRRGLPYPPGPRPLPIIGNLLDIPMEFSWLTYSQLAKKYGTSYVLFACPLFSALAGDVMSFHVLGRVVVILGSTEATKNLLGKRGNVYSDRPVIPFFEMYVHKFGISRFRLKMFQDGCTMECTTGEIWGALAVWAQNRRTELPPCVPVSVPCHTRDQSSCSRYSPLAKSARMDISH